MLLDTCSVKNCRKKYPDIHMRIKFTIIQCKKKGGIGKGRQHQTKTKTKLVVTKMKMLAISHKNSPLKAMFCDF